MSYLRSRPAPAVRRVARSPGAAPRGMLRASFLLCASLALSGAAQAFDAGPFSLTGFVKAEVGRGSNICDNCQREPGEDRQRFWADPLAYGRHYGTETTHTVLFQPYLGAKFDLPRGWKLQGMLSQRFRDGNADFPGFLYEASVSLQHEDYGTLQAGKFVSRTWAFADYPYASDIGLSPAFSDSGAGYGLLTNAVRYTSRTIDFAEGDLVLEFTWDRGDTAFKIHKPRLFEYWVHYGRDRLRLDAMIQDSRNGRPTAFSHGPFSALTADAADDPKLGESSQGVVLLLAKYQYTPSLEFSGGVRFNRWSGAYAVQTSGNLWNAMFNVDWGGVDANGNPNPGYPARSRDVMVGVRYQFDRWTASAGLAYLGKASTANPSERGQSNSALFESAGLKYDVGRGLQLYGSINAVHYDHKGLAPLSMPSHSAFSNVDSRIADQGNWLILGALYTF